MNTASSEISISRVDFYVILMAKNLVEQQRFYQSIIGLDVIFQSQEAIGLGHDGKVFLLLKQDVSKDSHHLSDHKGPSILTFKVSGNISTWDENIKLNGLKVRDHLVLPEYQTSYLFIEDYEGNEICLVFKETD